MAVQLILGRPGSGKSRFIRHDIANRAQGGQVFLLVPEQQTYESERALIEALGTGGLLGVEVLSFSRLAKRVLGETGANWGTHIDHAGLCMALRRVLQECGGSLQAYAQAHKQTGFIETCLSYLQRCKQYDITPEALSEAAQKQAPLLRAKLHDFALIQTKLSEFLAERYLDACDEINECIRQIPSSPSVCGAHIYIDGFERMNAQRYRIVEALMQHAAHVTITFRVDPDENARDAALFMTEYASLSKIAAMAQSLGLPTERIALPLSGAEWGALRRRRPALWHLERELFATAQQIYARRTGALALTPCASASDEAHRVALEIARLARKGVRYCDIAVVVSDLGRYAQALRRSLQQFGIPHFLDASRPLAGHSLIELLLASAACACRGFDTRELLRVAKSGFAAVTDDEAEILENIALRRGLQGRMWLNAFEGECEANEDARQRLISPLADLRDALDKANGAQGCASAILAYLEALGVREKLEQRQSMLYAEGRHELAQENAQVWRIVLAVLDQLVIIWGDAPMKPARFLALLEAGFAAHSVGAIPSTADEIAISDLSRTRTGSVRVLFLLGGNEIGDGAGGENVINNAELACMRASGLEVWPDAQWEAAQDRLLLHAVLCRPTHRLYVSYARMDTDGRELSPSLFVKLLQRCFTRLAEMKAAEPDELYAPGQALALLCGALGREPDKISEDILGYLWQDRSQNGLNLLMHTLQSAPEQASISPVTAGKLYGKRMVTTASRIEQFYRCPFAHIATYGVRAKERKERTAARPDAGLLLHKVLEEAVREVTAAGMDWRDLNEADLDALLERVWERVTATFDGGLWTASGRLRAQAARLKRVARRSLLAIASQFALSDFQLAGVEMVFGPGQPYPAYPLDAQTLLSGKIDRLDICPGETPYARIVDYKLGDQPLKYADIAGGNRLQLLLYMSAAMYFAKLQYGALLPAGMFLMGLQDPYTDEDASLPALRLQGLLAEGADVMRAMDHTDGKQSPLIQVQRRTADGSPYGRQVLSIEQLEASMRYARTKALQAVSRMQDGAAEAMPLQTNGKLACEGCLFADACGFESSMPGARVRKAAASDRDAFLKLIEGGELA